MQLDTVHTFFGVHFISTTGLSMKGWGHDVGCWNDPHDPALMPRLTQCNVVHEGGGGGAATSGIGAAINTS